MNLVIVSVFVGGIFGLIFTWFMKPNKEEEDDKDWKNKHVVITGGSKGLGLAFAKHVLEEGAYVTLLSRSKVNLDAAKESLDEKYRSRVSVRECDVTDPRVCNTVVMQVATQRPIDCAVACAGTARPGMLLDTDNDVYAEQIVLNYMGTINFIKPALRVMTGDRKKKEQNKKRRLIVVSSASGLVSIPGYTAYSASKFALRGLCDGLRAEMKPHNIDVHIFYPSSIDTEGYKEENKTKPEPTKRIEGEVSLWTPEQAANHLCYGVKCNYYQITTDWIIDLIATTSNGVQPRKFLLLEILLLPLVPFVEWYYRTMVIERAMRV